MCLPFWSRANPLPQNTLLSSFYNIVYRYEIVLTIKMDILFSFFVMKMINQIRRHANLLNTLKNCVKSCHDHFTIAKAWFLESVLTSNWRDPILSKWFSRDWHIIFIFIYILSIVAYPMQKRKYIAYRAAYIKFVLSIIRTMLQAHKGSARGRWAASDPKEYIY